MSIVSSIIAKSLGQSNTEGINLLKDISGNSYPTISAMLRGENLTAIAVQFADGELETLLPSDEAALLEADLAAGVVPPAHLWMFGKALIAKCEAALGVSAAIQADTTAVLTSVENLFISPTVTS